MKIFFINDITKDVVFQLPDGTKKWFSDMNPKEKSEANQLLDAFWQNKNDHAQICESLRLSYAGGFGE